MPLLTVENLSVTYRQDGAPVGAVDGVSFAIEPGEVLALVGGSGSGKSSVALALARLLPPTASVSGRVMLNEADLLDAPEATLRAIRGGTIAYVFQDPAASLNPVLTIGEQLVEMLTRHTPLRGREAEQAAVEWLGRVGIASAAERPLDPPATGGVARGHPEPVEGLLHAYPHEFSGGMQQRVCLAMALCASPSLLVADEPTTALDVTVQVQILRLLRELQRRLGLAVLLISHDLLVVERLAHRIGIMAGGRLVELGSAEQVLRQPAHDQTKLLLRARSILSLRR